MRQQKHFADLSLDDLDLASGGADREAVFDAGRCAVEQGLTWGSWLPGLGTAARIGMYGTGRAAQVVDPACRRTVDRAVRGSGDAISRSISRSYDYENTGVMDDEQPRGWLTRQIFGDRPDPSPPE